MRTFLRYTLLILLSVAALVWLFTPVPSGQHTAKPWQVKVHADGSTDVLGVTLSQTTLGQAQARFSDTAQFAYIVEPNKKMVVELFYEHVRLGGVAGKLVFTAPTSQKISEARLKKSQKAESGSRFLPLEDDWKIFSDAVIQQAAFIPSKNLSEEIITRTFGKPAEVLPEGIINKHFLYPEIGVDVVLNSLGKDVVQYVLPSQFDKIKAPLLALPRIPNP